jgi:hypothetical protein
MAMIYLVDLAPSSIRSKLKQTGFSSSNTNSGPVIPFFCNNEDVKSHEDRRCLSTDTLLGQLATLIAVVEHTGAGLVFPRVMVPSPPQPPKRG